MYIDQQSDFLIVYYRSICVCGQNEHARISMEARFALAETGQLYKYPLIQDWKIH